MSKNIKITWKAFGDKPERGRFISSVEFELGSVTGQNINEIADVNICEWIYKDTNTYSGLIWNQIEKKLSETRTHTSISVGDEIEINGQVYICADFGFEKIEDVEIKKFGDSVFSVSKKEEVGV
jgi:hypothetical protein